MLAIALFVRFCLELALLAVAGWSVYSASPLGWACSAGIVIAVALVWGIFLSPKRRIELGAIARLLIELALFLLAAAALYLQQHPVLAAILSLVEIADKGLLTLLQRQGRD